MKKLLVLSVVALIALTGFSSPASATYSFNLNISNTVFSGPMVRVDVTLLTPFFAEVEFTSLVQNHPTFGPIIFLLGDGGSVAVNVNAANWSLGGLFGTNSGSGFTPGPYFDAGPGNEDGFGQFNQTVDTFDGYTHSSDNILFSLTNNTGFWASEQDVLINNAFGFKAAAHIFVTPNPANASYPAILTGFASGEQPVVPEPTSMLLFGLGLVGAGVARRRRRN